MAAPAHQVLTLVRGILDEIEAITEAVDSASDGPAAGDQPRAVTVARDDVAGQLELVALAGGRVRGLEAASPAPTEAAAAQCGGGFDDLVLLPVEPIEAVRARIMAGRS